MYHIGQEVEWVGPESPPDDEIFRELGFEWPQRKKVYTISAAKLVPMFGAAYQLGGLRQSISTPAMSANSWWPHEFLRPLEKRKTDISIFKRLLEPNAKIDPKILEDA